VFACHKAKGTTDPVSTCLSTNLTGRLVGNFGDLWIIENAEKSENNEYWGVALTLESGWHQPENHLVFQQNLGAQVMSRKWTIELSSASSFV